jgi:hypothetical protein
VEEYLKSDEIGGATKEGLARRRRAFLEAGLRGYLQEELKSDIADLNHDCVPAFDVAQLYARLGDKDRAFENLEKTYKEGGHNIAFLRVEPGPGRPSSFRPTLCRPSTQTEIAEFVEHLHQMLRTPSQAVTRPDDNHMEPMVASVHQHLV